jgi:phosphohistidine phosphatase SixA
VTGALTAEGHERAQALVQALGDTRIAAIYSPKLERNLDTVKPLARHLGVDITVVDEKLSPDAIVALLLKDHAGKGVLWVGNTANLGEIYYRLGGQGEPPNDYGDLYVLSVPPRGVPVVEKKRFGR